MLTITRRILLRFGRENHGCDPWINLLQSIQVLLRAKSGCLGHIKLTRVSSNINVLRADRSVHAVEAVQIMNHAAD